MIKLGLTFSGGGGKGAYEIGVWKALKEFGMVEHIKAVSGTSVGALNAALFIGSDFEQGEKVWNTISKDTILSANSLGLTPEKIAAFLASISIAAGPVLLTAIRMYAFLGVFSQSGLEKIIRDNINFDQITKSDIPLFVCAYSLKTRKPEYIKLNDKNPEDIVQYLLASSAMPIIWDPVVVEGTRYVDGGIPIFGDNIPVSPVVNESCDMVITVILDQGSEFGKKEQQYDNSKFWKIVPKENQGEFISGTLDFDPAHAKIRIAQGYEDTKEVLQNFFEFKLIEEKFVKSAEEIKTLDTNFLLMAKNNKLFRTQAREMRREMSDGQNSLQYLLKHSTSTNEIVVQNTVRQELNKIENQSAEIEKLLDQTEKNLINNSLDKTIESMKNNSTEIKKLAFEALTAIAPVQGRSKYLQEQGHLKRIWNGVTGKNLGLMAESQNDIYKSVYITNQFMKKLAEKGQMTMEILVSYGNKLEYLQQQIQHQNIISNSMYQCMQLLDGTIKHLTEQLQNKFQEIDNDLGEIKRRQNLTEWVVIIESNEYDGVVYSELDDNLKIVLVVNQIFRIVEGKVTSNHYGFLKTALKKIGIADDHKIDVNRFFYDLRMRKGLLEEYEKTIDLDRTLFSALKDDVDYYPILKGLQVEMSNQAYSQKHENNNAIVAGYFSKKSTLNTINFAVEMLYSLSIANDYRNRLVRSEYVINLENYMEKLEGIVSEHSISKKTKSELEQIKHKISDFKIVVPLIGNFSSGKSSLINAVLGNNILSTGLRPVTSFATELVYGETEEVTVFGFDDEVIGTLNISELATIDESITGRIRISLSNEFLKYNRDIVFVDMPGLDSGKNSHNRSINKYLRSEMHFVVVMDIEDGSIKQATLNFIKELARYNIQIAIMLNKIDKKPNSEVLEMQKYIKESASGYFDDPYVGLVSSNENNLKDFSDYIQSLNKDTCLHNSLMETVRPFLSQLNEELLLLAKIDDIDSKDGDKISALIDKSDDHLKKLEDDMLNDKAYSVKGAILNTTMDHIKSHLRMVSRTLAISLKSGEVVFVNEIVNQIRPLIISRVNETYTNLYDDIWKNHAVINYEISQIIDKNNLLNSAVTEAMSETSEVVGLTEDNLGEIDSIQTEDSPETTSSEEMVSEKSMSIVTPLLDQIQQLLSVDIGRMMSTYKSGKNVEKDVEEIQRGIIPQISSKIRPIVKNTLKNVRERSMTTVHSEVQNKKDTITAMLERINSSESKKHASGDDGVGGIKGAILELSQISEFFNN